MSDGIHPGAVVDPGAVLAADVRVGPGAVIGPGVVIGAGSEVAAHAIIERDTDVGAGCTIGYGAVVGSAPQDRGYRGEPTRVEIGDGTVLREYATVHRATAARLVTRVGRRCLLMAYVHVAHDCALGDDVTIANAVQLAGHVTVGDGATIGGLTPIHQFVRIGELAFVGGGSRVPQDVPPFTRAAGNPLRLIGINALGLERAGIAPDTIEALRHAYRLLFNSERRRAEAVAELEGTAAAHPPVARLLAFLADSARGVLAR